MSKGIYTNNVDVIDGCRTCFEILFLQIEQKLPQNPSFLRYIRPSQKVKNRYCEARIAAQRKIW